MRGIQKHPYHIVDGSPWPILASLICLIMTSGGVMKLQGYEKGDILLPLGIILILLLMSLWWRDVIRESTLEGSHTKRVMKGIKIGMLLFIISEIFFFISFFWTYLHSSLVPTVSIGNMWPPIGIEVLEAGEIPLLNTIILLLSGGTITWSHHSIISGEKKEGEISLMLTIILGIIFIILQGLEYKNAGFTISDGIYGSIFYMSTGFHGIHIIIGTIFILVGLIRLYNNHYTKHHIVGLEAGIWYWHMVDVVWILLYICIYWWGGGGLNNDGPEPWGIGLQDPASRIYESLINLHDQILYYLIIIVIGVLWILIKILIRKNEITYKYNNHGTIIEIIWTIIPALILIAIAYPSFKLLYLMDEVIDPSITVKVIGRQWYWSYEIDDYENYNIELDSYMIPTDDLEEGQLRLLEVDNRLILPIKTHIRFIITGGDVMHSWAIPSLGIKMDAIPGRLNQTSTIIDRKGVYYGNCSELCGSNHNGMPIVIEGVSCGEYLTWIEGWIT